MSHYELQYLNYTLKLVQKIVENIERIVREIFFNKIEKTLSCFIRLKGKTPKKNLFLKPALQVIENTL